ncbi:MAG: threonine synthase [Candidatus Sedimenticola endophacoides]|uniref:Threonine synthase n=2 Tax=Candidatus Sedimenticola endophacoides TaxID=2548426 RepID=A0A657Q4D6_9GAMM|nr:MAG: threonine synthase [Candidatus Sedimenticola endophacoides]OQX33029.1 MAG: threonine synthase [Candidatus Sedimenticola endophacoides]OQX41354.1 MAG: threonine synthase [Candidatus Sedimenticola endophacoides]OQX45185.1 MAG: threonine synthase [Candidatus Sedimenticola endophacoides]OQX49151.1 MAG: threonine synthase [Candidatus Sedimenticola endophacoides]
MRYISTRGGVEPVSFADAVMMGLATDGGLLLPESFPEVDAATLRRWAGLPFQELAVEVMLPYVGGDIRREELEELVTRSYAAFSHPEVTPVVQAGERHILELFHGPTAAFKDVALQFLGNLFDFLLGRSGGRLNILGATSGDTGSAAIYGVRGQERVDIFILHPHKRVSPIQERQMTTVLDANVHNIAITGTFDDGQRIVKELFNDLEFKSEYSLGAVNSINWARILAQVVYYFYAWSRISGGDTGRKATFSVPTGNFGDIFAGYVAMRMGLPVERLILATNRNDILSRFINSGVYSAGDVHPTVSPSMDIQVSSNFERYLYFLMDEDPGQVRELMARMAGEGRIEIPEEKRAEVARLFVASATDEEATLEQIRLTYTESGYILDPHTAVGVRAAADYPEAICLATAHPAKFGEAVARAIGVEAPPPPSLQGLMEKQTRCEILGADAGAIRSYMKETLAGR